MITGEGRPRFDFALAWLADEGIVDEEGPAGGDGTGRQQQWTSRCDYHRGRSAPLDERDVLGSEHVDNQRLRQQPFNE